MSVEPPVLLPPPPFPEEEAPPPPPEEDEWLPPLPLVGELPHEATATMGMTEARR
jgi:hypothetical protein